MTPPRPSNPWAQDPRPDPGDSWQPLMPAPEHQDPDVEFDLDESGDPTTTEPEDAQRDGAERGANTSGEPAPARSPATPPVPVTTQPPDLPSANPSAGPRRGGEQRAEASARLDRGEGPARSSGTAAIAGVLAVEPAPRPDLQRARPRPPDRNPPPPSSRRAPVWGARQPDPPRPSRGPTRAPAPQTVAPEVDPDLVNAVRERVDALLDEEVRVRKESGREQLSEDSERALVGSLLSQAIGWTLTGWRRRGRPAPNEDDPALREAVLAEMFGLGRLEQLLAAPDVENIDITGCDPARLTLTDGSRRLGPPVASSDDELVRMLRRIAERRSRVERTINASRPLLNLELPGGQRLAATLGVSARPAVSIRIHRHRDMTMARLVELHTLSQAERAFLTAAIRAGKNIVVTGGQKVGKSTLLLGLCTEIPADEQLATLETEIELGLHRNPERWPDVLALEERQPNTEHDGRPGGGISLEQLVWQSLRMHRSRLIFGEVRGPEIVPMLDALSTGGAGALATLHSRSATGAVERMVSLCLGARPGWSTAFAYRLIAEAIDLIVHVRMDRVRDETGMIALDRYVDEIIAVSPGEDGRPAFTRIFRPDPRSGLGQRGMPTEHRPPNFQDYLDAGLDPAVLRAPSGGWARPRPAVAG